MPNGNYWGRILPTLAEIASESATRDHLRSQLAAMLGGPSASTTLMFVAEQILELASQELPRYEADARALLVLEGLLGGHRRDLRREIDHLYRASRPNLVGSSLIDFGCGDGSMGRRFAAGGLEVTLSDVLQPMELEGLGLPFVLAAADGSTPLADGAFDNAVAFGVLHHCEDPRRSMSELVRLVRPGGRLVIVESVFGVQLSDFKDGHPLQDSLFVRLSEEQQLHHTMYFDHFVNRIVGSYSDEASMKVNMPFNYNTPSGWNEAFGRLGAWAVLTFHLEVQVGRAPLHHTLHVFETPV